MFESAFKGIDNAMNTDPGCSTALDYAEQASWILFLKYLDDLEKERATRAILQGETYSPLIEEQFRWESWAAPKTADGTLDFHRAQTGDDLLDFVNNQLWPYMRSFKSSAEDAQTLQYKVGEIFSEVKNKFQSGYNLRDVLTRVDELSFESAEHRHELSALYEDRIKQMGNAGRNGGEYYTPRPLIRAMVKVIDPKVGETVYDPACGSAGFLVEAYHHMRSAAGLTTEQLEILQNSTFVGKELKSLAYIIGTMNMILHGIEAPKILHVNTLQENVMQIQDKDKYDVVLANPPFGGNERKEVQQNFSIRSGETAYLFLQHFMRSLKVGGRAAVVIKNTFLSNGDAASLRRELLEMCDLHTVLDCPQGTFTGTGVKTVVLFFTKGKPTQKIWYYQLNPGRSLGKTNPLNDQDLAEFISLYSTRGNTETSWTVDLSDVAEDSLDLSVKNPNKTEEVDTRTPSEILDEIQRLDDEARQLLDKIRELL